MGDYTKTYKVINSALINTSPSYIWTSVLTAYPGHRVTVGITMGSKDATTGSLTSGGSFTGTIRLQRSFDNGAFWRDVASWTAATESTTDKPEPQTVQYRLGSYNTDHTSGEVVLWMGVGFVS